MRSPYMVGRVARHYDMPVTNNPYNGCEAANQWLKGWLREDDAIKDAEAANRLDAVEMTIGLLSWLCLLVAIGSGVWEVLAKWWWLL